MSRWPVLCWFQVSHRDLSNAAAAHISLCVSAEVIQSPIRAKKKKGQRSTPPNKRQRAEHPPMVTSLSSSWSVYGITFDKPVLVVSASESGGDLVEMSSFISTAAKNMIRIMWLWTSLDLIIYSAYIHIGQVIVSLDKYKGSSYISVAFLWSIKKWANQLKYEWMSEWIYSFQTV